jgi:hypothetical protein
MVASRLVQIYMATGFPPLIVLDSLLNAQNIYIGGGMV